VLGRDFLRHFRIEGDFITGILLHGDADLFRHPHDGAPPRPRRAVQLGGHHFEPHLVPARQLPPLCPRCPGGPGEQVFPQRRPGNQGPDERVGDSSIDDIAVDLFATPLGVAVPEP